MQRLKLLTTHVHIPPELVDGYTYANLMNEARTTRNKEAFFSDEKLYILRNGLDKDLYPNVDWMDVLLKKGHQLIEQL